MLMINVIFNLRKCLLLYQISNLWKSFPQVRNRSLHLSGEMARQSRDGCCKGDCKMIFGPGSKEKLAEWQETHKRFRDKLSPNCKSGKEVLAYLKNKYILDELTEEQHLHVVSQNVLNNDFYKQKLPDGKLPNPKIFILKNEGKGNEIYKEQEDIWERCPVFIGIDLSSGYIHIEGSCLLYDEIFAFQGIDKYDLENCVRVADYIECIKQFNMEYYNSLL